MDFAGLILKPGCPLDAHSFPATRLAPVSLPEVRVGGVAISDPDRGVAVAHSFPAPWSSAPDDRQKSRS
jgi:hypothetical protein